MRKRKDDIPSNVAAEIDRLIVTLMKDRAGTRNKGLTMDEWKALLEHLARMAAEK